MKYFGIKTPEKKTRKSEIFRFSKDDHGAWRSFFFNRNYECGICPQGICMADAIKAYKSIGFKCVELEIKEIEQE